VAADFYDTIEILENFMKANKAIDFTKIEWDKIKPEELQFFFNQAVEANDAILEGISNLNNKSYCRTCHSYRISSCHMGQSWSENYSNHFNLCKHRAFSCCFIVTRSSFSPYCLHWQGYARIIVFPRYI